MQWTLCSCVRKFVWLYVCAFVQGAKEKEVSLCLLLNCHAWKYCLLAKRIGCEPFELRMNEYVGLVVRIHTKCSVFMRLSLLLLTFIYPLELVFKQIIHTFCACWRSTLTYTFDLFLSPSQSHTLCLCMCANGGPKCVNRKLRGTRNYAMRLLLHTHRSKWTSERKKATTTMDAITLHELSQPEKNWWFRNEWIIFCLFHLFAQNINADIKFRGSDSNDFFFCHCLSSTHCFT